MKNFIGQQVIIRADRAGVFFGTLESKEGQTVELSNCRKLFYWNGAAAVEQIAVDGVSDPKNCKFTVVVDRMVIEGVCQTIPCTQKAIDSINEVSVWKR